MLIYSQLNHYKPNSVPPHMIQNNWKYDDFFFREMHLKISFAKCGPLCSHHSVFTDVGVHVQISGGMIYLRRWKIKIKKNLQMFIILFVECFASYLLQTCHYCDAWEVWNCLICGQYLSELVGWRSWVHFCGSSICSSGPVRSSKR